MVKLDKKTAIEMFVAGSTQEEIGDLFDVSRQRVQQILKAVGIDRKVGGATVAAAIRVRRLISLRDERYMKMYQITSTEYNNIVISYGAKVFRAFQTQRQNSKKRGIEFNLTFKQWWEIWVQSGKWGCRGAKHGQFVMSRYGDIGPYETGNVKIFPATENIREYWDRKRATSRL